MLSGFKLYLQPPFQWRRQHRFPCWTLKQELIVVMDRQLPAEDLLNYGENNGGSLKEDQAKGKDKTMTGQEEKMTPQTG